MRQKNQAQIEAELVAYYDSEADNRAKLKTKGRRLIAVERALSQSLPDSPGLVLDVGPGPGRDVESLMALGHEVVGMDLSIENAKGCSERGVMALTGSAIAVPFANDSFDAVWSLSVLMHISDEAIERALRELGRVLRPGGVAIIGTWGGPDDEIQVLSSNVAIERNFSRRSNEVWRALLTKNLGELEHYETWPDPKGEDGWFYQWAEVRTDCLRTS